MNRFERIAQRIIAAVKPQDVLDAFRRGDITYSISVSDFGTERNMKVKIGEFVVPYTLMFRPRDSKRKLQKMAFAAAKQFVDTMKKNLARRS